MAKRNRQTKDDLLAQTQERERYFWGGRPAFWMDLSPRQWAKYVHGFQSKQPGSKSLFRTQGPGCVMFLCSLVMIALVTFAMQNSPSELFGIFLMVVIILVWAILVRKIFAL
jgi:hypothetical protein